MAYYNVLLGLVLTYVVKIAKGDFVGATPELANAEYEALSSSPVLISLTAIIMLAVLSWVVLKGLKDGIEKYCKVLMPVLFIMLLIVAIRSCTLDGASAGIIWYLKPDFSKITFETVLMALPQVFFATGVGMAVAFVYGSYLDDRSGSIPGDAAVIIAINTCIALLAGLCMFPAIFAFGMEPDLGPSLIFKTMPVLFSQMPMGRVFGTIFFTLVLIAASLTAIGFIEAIAGAFADAVKISKKISTLITTIVIFLLNIPVILSYGPWSDVSVFGKNFFDLADYFSGNILLPWAGVVLVAFLIFKWKFEGYMTDTNTGAGRLKVQTWWKPILLILIPIVMLFVAVGSLINI